MSDVNKPKPSSGNDNASATVQTSTVLGASDGLIMEGQAAENPSKRKDIADLTPEELEALLLELDEEEALEEAEGAEKAKAAAGVDAKTQLFDSSTSIMNAPGAVVAPELSQGRSAPAGIATDAAISSGTSVASDEDESAQDGTDEDELTDSEDLIEEVIDEVEEEASDSEPSDDGTVTSEPDLLSSFIVDDVTTQDRFEISTPALPPIPLEPIPLEAVVEPEPPIQVEAQDFASTTIITEESDGAAILVGQAGELLSDSGDEASTIASVNGQPLNALGTVTFQGLYGELSVNSAGDWSYKATALSEDALQTPSEPLTEHFDYTVTNGSTSATGSLDISLSHAPQAQEGSLQVSEDSGYTIGQLQAMDGDNDALSYELISGPDKGFVTVDEDGQYRFVTGADFETLNAGESEQVSFSYSVTDVDGNKDTATVQVTVNGAVDAPFGDNLVVNSSAENGTLNGWTITANGGNGWAVTGVGQEGSQSFISSYGWGRKSQIIDLEAQGFSLDDLDSAPDINASEWYQGIQTTSDQYYFKVELRGANDEVIDSFDTGILTANGQWQEVAHQFTDYGAGVRFIYVEHGGKDTEYWAGHYGTAIDNTQIVIDLPQSAGTDEGSLSIDSSFFQIVDGDLLGTEVSGQIVEQNGYTTLDKWHLNHEGGEFLVTLDASGGNQWEAGIRLYQSNSRGDIGLEVGEFEALLSPSGGSLQVITFSDLPQGHYQLVVGNQGFDESSVKSGLDFPGITSGEHEYSVTLSGNTTVATLPDDPGQNAAITGETYDQTEGILSLAVVNNDLNMVDPDNALYYEIFNDDVRVGQGQLEFSDDNHQQEISVTIGNESLETLTLDELQLVFHEINDDGVSVNSQTFDFEQAATEAGEVIVAQGGDGLQGMELMALGLDYFELGFYEIIDDSQTQGL
ncbi:VCBS domain-containing protein [uncultured Endozoicomonas sp.]|uniref:Ig-like domain-containing protein n=1 Tax=uncultured Endozoicomonas sp. TaxID=432652 RepID=UPI002633B9A9|nr:VCBS domain-containing protein [uncultured Endozoicomonas sp.]